MRTTLTLLCVSVLAGTVAVAAVNRRELRHNLISKRAVAGIVGRATAGTIVNSPHQWGRSPEGFAKRVGSGFGKHVIKQTIQAGVASVHHEDLHYRPSNRKGTLPRLEYAVKSTFIVPRTNKPGKTLALGRVSGNMGAGLASQ